MANGTFAASATHLSGGVDGTVGAAQQMFVDGTNLYIAVAKNTNSGKNWRKLVLASL